MKLVFFILLLSASISYGQNADLQAAVNYLNNVRTKPQIYGSNLGELAKAAQQKAEDMATRNYFAHINPDGYGMNYFINLNGYSLEKDWLANKEDNFFESLCAGPSSPKEAIKVLLIDAGVPSLGHRKHLLGLEKMWATCYDIGIGWAKGKHATYSDYYCVLIAKHTWTKTSTGGGSIEYNRKR